VRGQSESPIQLEIFRHALEYAAEEMGIVLRRTAYSPNIKERLDYSCAIFDPSGRLAAQAEHIPVHLGAMPSALKTILADFGNDIHEGDVFAFNDPFRGGTHLPDITVAAPIFSEHEILAFVCNRAHHADVGGAVAGSMSGVSSEVYEEGLILPPVRLQTKGSLNLDILHIIEANVRTPQERNGDLRAQIASLNLGKTRLLELQERLGTETTLGYMQSLMNYSEKLTRREIRKLPDGDFTAEDFLDDDGKNDTPVRLQVSVRKRADEITFDFQGTETQRPGPINAPLPVTLSAIYFVMRCLTDPSIPTNDGCYRPIHIEAPAGTVVNALSPAAVAGGNVETSQRIVDVTLKALSKVLLDRVPAACQGTMNNMTVGGTSPQGSRFSYYETIAGGFGGRKGSAGPSGVHSHMTNTLNTPIEALENSYPLRVTRYELVDGSGGEGEFEGGLGVRRDIVICTTEAIVSLMGDRQKFKPWGLAGGEDAKTGEYMLIDPAGKVSPLRSKTTVHVKEGWTVSIRTPGGGGYGSKRERRC
jgi:N-methylhydantoinase B